MREAPGQAALSPKPAEISALQLIELMKEPKFASELERRFTMIFVEKRERANALLWHHGNWLFWLISIVAGVAIKVDQHVFTALLVSAAILATLSLASLALLQKSPWLRWLQLYGYVGCSVAFWIMTQIDTAGGDTGHRGVAAMWILGASLGIGLLAFRNWVHTAIAPVILGLMAHGLSGYPEPYLGWLFGLCLLLLSSNGQIIMHRLSKLQAIRTFREQAKFTPKQIIVRSIELGAPVREVFQPSLRFCACICSDWRGFQSWAARTPPSVMAGTLSAYYTTQIELLDKAFPEGNYFLDWIADELFVVAFTTEKSDQRKVARAAISFAKACLAARPPFAERHFVPSGIDVGIAFGPATVGILGPDGNAKATALGEVPGMRTRGSYHQPAAAGFAGEQNLCRSQH